MDPFIVIVGLLLLVVGTGAALAWWHLARRAAPYQDESGKPAGSKAKPDDGAEVIVLPSPGTSKPGGRSES